MLRYGLLIRADIKGLQAARLSLCGGFDNPAPWRRTARADHMSHCTRLSICL